MIIIIRLKGDIKMPLYTLKKSCCCTIKNLPNIKLLHSMGLREGLSLSVVTKQPFGGPIVVQIGSRCIALGKDVAEQIEISNISTQAAYNISQAKVNEVY